MRSGNPLHVLAGVLLVTAACGGSARYKERQAALAKAPAPAALQGSKQEAPKTCTALGAVDGRDPKMYAPFASMGANSEGAMENLREKALERGANYVVLDGVFGPIANGRIYHCPPEALAGDGAAAPPGGPPPAGAPASKPCKPDCSPGYACVDGTCVSACNPACAAGQQCGVDRVCHPGGV